MRLKKKIEWKLGLSDVSYYSFILLQEISHQNLPFILKNIIQQESYHKKVIFRQLLQAIQHEYLRDGLFFNRFVRKQSIWSLLFNSNSLWQEYWKFSNNSAGLIAVLSGIKFLILWKGVTMKGVNLDENRLMDFPLHFSFLVFTLIRRHKPFYTASFITAKRIMSLIWMFSCNIV